MTIHIDPARINITPGLPQERAVLRNPNIATLDNLLAAIDDGDTEACNSDDGLPTEATWRRVVKCWRLLEAGK